MCTNNNVCMLKLSRVHMLSCRECNKANLGEQIRDFESIDNNTIHSIQEVLVKKTKNV